MLTSRYLPIILFVAFIFIILTILPFIAKDENEKIYRPGTLEKYLLQKAARIQQRIRQTLQTLAERPALPVHVPETSHDASALTFHGDLALNGDLNPAWLQQHATAAGAALPAHIIIDGNLTLHGALHGGDGLQLTVHGNVHADSLILANSRIDIHGELHSALGIYGEDPAGALQVGGALHTPYLLTNDNPMPRRAASEHIYLNHGNIGYMPASTDGPDAFPIDDHIERGAHDWYYFKNSPRMLLPEACDENGAFAPARFRALIASGENPFIRTATG